METWRLVKGVHTRKTAAFVRACAAYCYITIPSVDNILLRLNLYLLSGRVAVANGALSQGSVYSLCILFTVYYIHCVFFASIQITVYIYSLPIHLTCMSVSIHVYIFSGYS